MGTAKDRTHERRPLNNFFTIDRRVIPALLRHFMPRGRVWEPAAGKGDMAMALELAGHMTYPTDLVDYGAPVDVVHGDFFDFQEVPDPTLQTIVTNPPNEWNLKFALHALELMRPVRGMVAFYQRHEWNTNQNTAPIFDHPAYAMKIVCRFRPRWIRKEDEPPPKPGEKKKSRSPFHRFSWYVWDWQHEGPPIERFS